VCPRRSTAIVAGPCGSSAAEFNGASIRAALTFGVVSCLPPNIAVALLKSWPSELADDEVDANAVMPIARHANSTNSRAILILLMDREWEAEEKRDGGSVLMGLLK